MTKEELEKEAEDYADNQIGCGDGYYEWTDVKEAYLAGAEPREKQIQIDAEQIRALQKQNGELTDKVNDLEEKLANADYQLEGRDNEIAELEQENKVLAQNLEDTDIVNKALEKENAELKSENQKWKDEWQVQVQKATDEGYARTLQTIQLSKAKELIINLMVYVPVDLKEYEEAEKFISEVEK